MFVIKRVEDGKYVAPDKSKQRYVTNPKDAQKYVNRSLAVAMSLPAVEKIESYDE